jgi:nucleoside-diphosphate-sugar epimerase
MLIAVTGATGFLGRYIVNDLLAQGHTCRCWYRATSDRTGFAEAGKRLQWLRGDLNKAGPTDSLVRGADAVIHAALARYGAAYAGSEGDIPGFTEINVQGSIRLMAAARKAGVKRFVFISSCAVHDVILPDRKLDEAHPLWPRGHYGAYKAAVEKFVHSYGLGEGWDICALRPTGIYGLAHPAEESRYLGLVRDVIAGKPLDLAGGGKEVHAADVAAAVRLLLEAPGVAGQAYNCYDLYVADQDVAQIAKRLTSSKSEIKGTNNGPKNQIDTDKLRALGMTFGGRALLEKTVEELVKVARG